MKRSICLIVLLILVHLTGESQVTENEYNPWIVGFGVNTIDDSGSRLGKFLDFNDNYHFRNPFQLVVEKRFRDDFGAKTILSTNVFEEGKVFNEGVLEESINFFSIDLSINYYVTNLFLDKYRAFFEGYITTGLGESFYDKEHATNFNVGGGLTFYVSKRIRVYGEALAKLSFIRREIGTNYLQYSAGLIYRIPVK